MITLLPTLPLGVTPAKAISDFTCFLAAIESLAADQSRPVTQRDLIHKFPEWCRRGFANSNGVLQEGSVGPMVTFHLLKALGFASTFVVGIGRAFIETHRGDVNTGIFCHTINHQNGKLGGFHCWRLAAVEKDGVVVVHTQPGTIEHGLSIPWADYDMLGCVVTVCVP